MPGLIQQHWLSPMGSNAVSRLLGNEARGLSTQVAIFAALTMGAPQAASDGEQSPAAGENTPQAISRLRGYVRMRRRDR
jgi:hypothetical protein